MALHIRPFSGIASIGSISMHSLSSESHSSREEEVAGENDKSSVPEQSSNRIAAFVALLLERGVSAPMEHRPIIASDSCAETKSMLLLLFLFLLSVEKKLWVVVVELLVLMKFGSDSLVSMYR